MTTRALKRLERIEQALHATITIEVDEETLPDDDERNQGPARQAGSGAALGSRSVRIFLGGLG